MSKTNKIYKIFMTTMIVAIAGMLLAMGIIAAQKTMKLGVRFSSNPNYRLEVWIEKNGSTAEPVFCNFEDDGLGKQVEMKNGISSLDGNTIVADSSFFTKYENDFTIIIKNYTKTTGIAVEMSSTAKIDGGADGVPAQIQAIDDTASKYNDQMGENADSVSFKIYVNSVFPQETTLSIVIEEQNEVSISYELTNINSTNTTTIMEPNTPYTTNLTVTNEADYTLPEEITVNIGGMDYNVPKNGSVEGITYDVTLDKTNYIFTGTLSIPGTLTTGNISLEGEGYIDYWGGPDTTPATLTTAGGGGSEADPYLIANGGQLASLINMDRAYYFRLIKNIYLNEGTVGETGGTVTSYIWTPLNLGDCPPVLFHGNMKTISGMYVVNVEDAGLFRNIGTGSSISELTFINSYIQGSDAAGALASSVYGLGITISGITIGEEGNNTSVVIAGNVAGGVVGSIRDIVTSFFDSCTNYATIQGVQYAGGMVGYGYFSRSFQCFKSCVNGGSVDGPASRFGGLAGYLEGTTSNASTYYDENCTSRNPTGLIGTAYDWD